MITKSYIYQANTTTPFIYSGLWGTSFITAVISVLFPALCGEASSISTYTGQIDAQTPAARGKWSPTMRGNLRTVLKSLLVREV
jgi:hypothetical protein